MCTYGPDHETTGGGKVILNTSGLKEGIVLGYIRAGKSLDIYYHLELDRLECQVTIIRDAHNNKAGRKDIIKIEGGLDTMGLKVLGHTDHMITVDVIKNDKIVERRALRLPHKTTNVVQYKNLRCITSTEQKLPYTSYLTDEKTGTYRYRYYKGKYSGD